MQRTCSALVKDGFTVTLQGKEKPDSPPLKERTYYQERMPLWIQKGKLYYLEFNIRLFWKLLFIKADVIGIIDLDGMPGSFLAAKLRGRKTSFDAHEFFTELPEIRNRPFTQKMWQFIESYCLPRIDTCYTINESYAALYKKKYHHHFHLVRNATVLEEKDFPAITSPYILYQGAVNMGRGIEEMILAMKEIDYKLIICGKGDVYDHCVQLVCENNLESKVEFRGFVEPDLLKAITLHAHIGFTLFSNEGSSYYYSLANRFFDYMHHGVPQIIIDFPEYRRIIEEFEIGILVPNMKPATLIAAIQRILTEAGLYDRLRANCILARQKYNWQNEEKTLLKIYNDWLCK